jgi:L-lactate dehydrogenase (cytochrome)
MGLEVARMLALGADGVLIGGAGAFALAGACQRGFSRRLELLSAELKATMALTEVTRAEPFNPRALAPGPPVRAPGRTCLK